MAIETRTVEYRYGDVLFEGLLAFESRFNQKRPAVLVFHAWEGRSEAQIEFAKDLAQCGYVGFAADLYGKGVAPATCDERQRRILGFLQDRALLKDRLLQILELVKGLPKVEADRIAAFRTSRGQVRTFEASPAFTVY